MPCSKKKGRHVHSAFSAGVTNDINYDESIKAVLFLLNSRCNVSLEKTAQFIWKRDGWGAKNLTWNCQMLKFIREMIHENNTAGAEGISAVRIAEFETRYDTIVQTAAKEYEDGPSSDYYCDGI